MSRPTDTERGARIALDYASALLAAAKGKDLFPVRLTPKHRQLWLGIKRVSEEQLAECRALREARA
ncbi:MAG TPA: hypothetical protein DDZ67_09115 [Xanthomonadaceae bacterium]|nr:hypothetical protein [Xanthomonadaceae bacterium]